MGKRKTWYERNEQEIDEIVKCFAFAWSLVMITIGVSGIVVAFMENDIPVYNLALVVIGIGGFTIGLLFIPKKRKS